MKYFFYCLIISLFTLPSCNKKVNSPVEATEEVENILKIDTEFLLRKTEQALLKKEDFILEVLDIKDSRCPVGVNCIRAGEIIFTLSMRHKGKEKKTQLAYPPQGKDLVNKTSFNNYTIELVRPNQPNHPQKIDVKDLGGLFIIYKN